MCFRAWPHVNLSTWCALFIALLFPNFSVPLLAGGSPQEIQSAHPVQSKVTGAARQLAAPTGDPILFITFNSGATQLLAAHRMSFTETQIKVGSESLNLNAVKQIQVVTPVSALRQPTQSPLIPRKGIHLGSKPGLYLYGLAGDRVISGRKLSALSPANRSGVSR